MESKYRLELMHAKCDWHNFGIFEDKDKAVDWVKKNSATLGSRHIVGTPNNGSVNTESFIACRLVEVPQRMVDSRPPQSRGYEVSPIMRDAYHGGA